jgi:serine/threonine protein kinase
MHVFFGPFPWTYREIASEKTLTALANLMDGVPKDQIRPFKNLQDPDLTAADKEFLLKIMKLDPRDRPTAADLLKDEWFSKE